MMGGFVRFVPLAVGLAIMVLFAVGLTLGPPQNIETAYKNKPIPAFSMPSLFDAAPPLAKADLQQGTPVLLNVFASWCAPCRAEHGELMRLSQSGVAIYALNYKDTRPAAKRFLNRLGNPYRGVGFDRRGAVALDLGVYGVPETFIIDGAGHVQLRHVGPLSAADVETKILPYFTKAMNSKPRKERADAVSR